MLQMTMPAPAESLDATMLPELLEHYFLDKRGTVSDSTLACYREQLAPFLRWFDEQCPDGTLSKVRLSEFAQWMRTDYRTRYGTAPSVNTAAHCVGRFKGFAHWAYKAGCTGTVNLADWTPVMRKRTTSLYFPTVDELSRLFASPRGIDRLRDLALFALLLATGMRRMEAAAATVDGVVWATPITDLTLGHDHSGHIHLRKVKFDAEGEGQGRNTVFCSATGLLLKAWIRFADRTGPDTIFDLTDSGMSQVVKRAAKDAGLPEIAPHAFRRAFADYWHERHGMAGMSILKRQLGHSLKGDVTFDHYIDPRNDRRVIAEIAKLYVSPVENMFIPWERLPVHIDEAADPAAH
ncbi:MAG: tyrosine-type recombinase/integrase [Azonexus sp.]